MSEQSGCRATIRLEHYSVLGKCSCGWWMRIAASSNRGGAQSKAIKRVNAAFTAHRPALTITMERDHV